MDDIIDIDRLIETYDVQTDPILQQYWKPVEERLWLTIESYGRDLNDYGATLSRHLMRTSAIGMYFLMDQMGFSKFAAQNFYDANLLQDLGKTHPAYDPALWSLPHRPTEEERAEKRRHTQRGNDLIDAALKDAPEALKNHPHITVIKTIQKYHHEKIDGTGQFGIEGNRLGVVIKSICLIDAYDGDMIHRPHQRMQRKPEEALRRLQTNPKYEGAFDPDIFAQFVKFQTFEKETRPCKNFTP